MGRRTVPILLEDFNDGIGGNQDVHHEHTRHVGPGNKGMDGDGGCCVRELWEVQEREAVKAAMRFTTCPVV